MPVLRSALPAVFATVEHRAWALALQRFLDGSAAYAPPLLPTQCRFGQWLYGNGRRLYASEASFNAVEGVHRRLHEETETADGAKAGLEAAASTALDAGGHLAQARNRTVLVARAWIREHGGGE